VNDATDLRLRAIRGATTTGADSSDEAVAARHEARHVYLREARRLRLDMPE
jgi:chorismate mutase